MARYCFHLEDYLDVKNSVKLPHIAEMERRSSNAGRLRQRTRRLQRWRIQSYSFASSTSKMHQQSSCFIDYSSSLRCGRSPSDISLESSPTKAKNCHCLHKPRSSSISASSRADTTHCSLVESNVIPCEDGNFSAFELIRQLSFSPPRQSKKRTNTDETEVSSSFDTSDSEHSVDLDLDIDFKQMHLSRRSPSPLLGLKYIEEVVQL